MTDTFASFLYSIALCVCTPCFYNSNEVGDSMFKQSIRFPLIFFVVLTVLKFISNKEVNWIENIMSSLIMFLFILLYKWAEIPYKWNKDDE